MLKLKRSSLQWYLWAMSEQPSEFGGRPGLVQSTDDGAVLTPFDEYFLSRQGQDESVAHSE